MQHWLKNSGDFSYWSSVIGEDMLQTGLPRHVLNFLGPPKSNPPLNLKVCIM